MNLPQRPSSEPNLFIRSVLLRTIAATAVGVGLVTAAWAVPSSEAKLSPSLVRLAIQQPEAPTIVWVYFTDRAGAEHDPATFGKVRSTWPAKTFERRARRGIVHGVQPSDLPVSEAYVRTILARGGRLRGTSRWLNAASVELPARDLIEIAKWPFVARVEPVASTTRRPSDRDRIVGEAIPEWNPTRAAGDLAPGDTAFYGLSFRQLAMMQVPELHAAGLSGAGVLVCMLDTGFKLDHEAFAGLDLVATRDFVNGDVDVGPDTLQDQPSQAQHGTWILGTIAARKFGTHVGGAFGAQFALGKTENVASETPIEMDFWQFGAEWADSLGADVISASLGYSVFDDTLDSYTYADMDGRTTLVTLAAAEAARRGITVVTAAGNEGSTPWHHIIAPADADTVVAVGAVDSFNVVTAFSSRGPTADGRTKPDVVAMGMRVLTGSFTDTTGYVRLSGTSLATPLAASVAALLLEAHPTWGPFEIREAMRETALNHASPDTIVGWGLVRGLVAREWTPTTGVPLATKTAPMSLHLGPNPLVRGSDVAIRLSLPTAARLTVDVVDLTGRRRARLFHGTAEGATRLTWNGTDSEGQPCAAGVYWICARSANAGSATRRVVLLP
jgi:subtilisin family serine protease